MFKIFPRCIDKNLLAVVANKQRVQTSTPYVIDVCKEGDSLVLTHYNPQFQPSMFAGEPNHCITEIVLEPCRMLKNSYKVTSATETTESPIKSYISRQTFSVNRRKTANWLRDLLKTLK